MDLRTKTLAIFAIGIIFILTGFTIYSSIVLQQSYENIEIKEVRGDIEQVEFAIDSELSDLDSTLRDWAEWDDTYYFIEENNSAYIRDNFQKDTFTTLDLNFVFLINRSNSVVFSEAYNKTTDDLEPVSSQLLEAVIRNNPAYKFQSPDADSSTKGIMFVDGKPMVLSIRPVLKSDGTGPAAGTMIMGRILDETRIERISKITGAGVTFIDPIIIPEDPQLRSIKARFDEGYPDVIQPLSPDSVVAYIQKSELNDTQRSYFIQIAEPRIIYQSGLSTVLSFLIIVIIAVIVFGALGLFLIDRMVLSRISIITNDVQAINFGEKNRRITEVQGDDELTQLSVAINRMLEQISHVQLRSKSIVEDLSEFICRFSADGTITFMNPAFRNYVKTLKKDDDRLSVFTIFQQVLPADTFDSLSKTLNAESPNTSGEYEYRLEGGDHFITWTISGIFDQEGKLEEYQFVGRDITEQKQTEAALQQVTKKLALLNYVTFNDIKNAIFTLRGYLSLGKICKTDDHMHQYLDRAEESVVRIEDSLNFAKQYQDLGMNAPRWQDVNHSFILGISHLDFSSVHRNIKLDGLEIYADPLLERVFFTLASNVLSHAGTATEIYLEYLIREDGLRLLFRDNGIGIPYGNKEKIFERGYGHQKGMELFLVREILGITGITIRENGTPGSGACFEIFVPKKAYRFPDMPWTG
jgi:PAS domain S-box-containing protein